jgi:hypothetical protein
MDFFNKAKEAISGGDSSSSKDKKDSSIFSKAMEAAEKYHAKEKVAEFAQKRVAKREEEKRQPGYTEKQDKSVIDKAVQAAEDFLAKQGDKPEDNKAAKPKENVESVAGRRRSCSGSSSSSSQSEFEKCPHAARNPEQPRAGASYPSREVDVKDSFSRMNLDSNGAPASSPVYSPPTQTPSYPSVVEGYPSHGGNSYPSGSSSGRYETYQEYWDRQGNNPNQSYPDGGQAASYGYGERNTTNGYAAYQGNASASYGNPSNDHV